MKFSIIYFVCLTILVYPTNVYAYLDPVSGSVILQSIIGVIAASILVIKTDYIGPKGWNESLKRYFAC